MFCTFALVLSLAATDRTKVGWLVEPSLAGAGEVLKIDPRPNWQVTAVLGFAAQWQRPTSKLKHVSIGNLISLCLSNAFQALH